MFRNQSPFPASTFGVSMLVLWTGLFSNGFCAEHPSDPILDLLLQKGIVTEAEVEKAKTEAERIRTNGPAMRMPPLDSK